MLTIHVTLVSTGVQFLSAVGYNTAGTQGALLATWPLCLVMFMSSALAGSLIWICVSIAVSPHVPYSLAASSGSV